MYSSVPSRGGATLAAFARYWLPLALWMMLIFSASADKKSYQHSSLLFEPLMRWLFPHLSPLTLDGLHHGFRKLGHLTEYAILAWLFWRAFRRPVRRDPRPWNWPAAACAFSLVFAYAATDEFHQIFVPSRTALVSDVFIDTAGGAAGLALLWLRWKLARPG